MTTTPIPADIMQAALRIANRKDILSLPFETREALADDIARAIMAERERITDKLYIAAMDGKTAFEAWKDLK